MSRTETGRVVRRTAGSDPITKSGSLVHPKDTPRNEALPLKNRHVHDRMKFFWNLPHFVALFSLLVLVVYISISVKVENARQVRTENLAQRCAFVYLVSSNKSDITNLGHSIQTLNKYSGFRMPYKVVVVHENIPPVVQGRVQALSEAPIHFRQFALDGPSTLNLSNEVSTFYKRSPWGYQKMIRFWFYSAILVDPARSAPLNDLDYIVRMDADTALTSRVSRDIIKDFALFGAQYGYQKISQDCEGNFTVGLRELAESFIEINGITPRSQKLWSLLTNSKKGCVPKFENHFEVMNVRFFRSHAGIQDWIKVVDANGGIFRHRWGDAALRFITVALYAAPEKVIKFDDVPCGHPHRMGKEK